MVMMLMSKLVAYVLGLVAKRLRLCPALSRFLVHDMPGLLLFLYIIELLYAAASNDVSLANLHEMLVIVFLTTFWSRGIF